MVSNEVQKVVVTAIFAGFMIAALEVSDRVFSKAVGNRQMPSPKKPSKPWKKKAKEQVDILNYWTIQHDYKELIDEVIDEAEDILRENA